MAKLISPFFNQIKGSIGNTTFFDTTDNPICARSRVVPFNPKSSPQQISRQCFLDAVNVWSAISTQLRDDYHALATFLKDHFPSSVKSANGRSLFLRLYTVQSIMRAQAAINYSGYTNINQDICSESPVTPATCNALTGPGTGFFIIMTNYHETDVFYTIEFSPPQKPTVYYYSGSYDWTQTASGSIMAAAGPGNPGIEGVPFTYLEAGMVYFLRIRFLASQGQPCNWNSIPLLLRCVCTTV
jgi:hypothetical protein